MKDDRDVSALKDGDEPMSNYSNNPHFSTVLAGAMSRRQMVGGSLAALGMASATGVTGFASAAGLGKQLPPSAEPPFALKPTLGFEAVPATRSDTVTVPLGYRAQAFIPWGTPLTGDYPAYDAINGNTGEEQEQQVGSHHDGMHYFPFAEDPNGHGLLCVNHEYVDQRLLHAAGPTIVDGRRPTDEVRKEIAAHGVSVVEIRKKQDQSGDWEVVRGKYNRRITAGTPMEIRGPVRGSDLVVTKYGPDGTKARGTINNCAHGYTPWGTYLTCEENWAGYFVNRTEADRPREQSRYGVPTSSSRYGWDTADSAADEYVRFDATITGASAAADYRNEPNTMGWVVEIDPFDPSSKPVKRTSLGRMGHEGAWLAPPRNGEPMVWYMGDDARNEYIYKFVSKARYNESVAAAARSDVELRRKLSDLFLDEGTLYVARFNEDGSGEWLPLDVRSPSFVAAAAALGTEFKSQADVLVNTRLAADVAGATRMDRPEWGAVHPQSRAVYFALTNNGNRASADTNASNPRGPNPFGHLIRWVEQGNRPWANRFAWDLFALAGDVGAGQVLPAQAGAALTESNIFASPDGLWIDQFGTLWIQTDMSGSQQASGPFGANAMLAANPQTGEIKRFLVGPNDQETTGVVSTPDGKTLFVNFQHPGDRSEVGTFTSNWPDGGSVFAPAGSPAVASSPTGARPRSATIVVTREDGGIVGR